MSPKRAISFKRWELQNLEISVDDEPKFVRDAAMDRTKNSGGDQIAGVMAQQLSYRDNSKVE